MKRAKTVIVLITMSIVLAGSISWADKKKPSAAVPTSTAKPATTPAPVPTPVATQAATQEVVWPEDKIQFKELIPGIKQAVLSGDPTKGEYAALTKFQAGLKNSLHIHTNDIKIVVISGTFLYGTETGEMKLGPGSYLVIPGGRKHTSGADSSSEGLFFESSPGKFDMKMIEQKPATPATPPAAPAAK